MKAIVAGNVVRLVPYLDDPSNAYAAADIVVARAGASTLAELAVTSTPAVLVPYPFASDDHQAVNARAFAAGGAAVVVRDADLTPATLEATLARCLDAETIARMRAAAGMLSPAGAATKIVDRIVALAGSRSAESAASNDEIAHG
jgi:UDP-N-acetylglucosamine--N-acetylmuramyl-(pentapeptide) pyrophosphoryl-undecaprenol N-acetylglucosamine transferase